MDRRPARHSRKNVAISPLIWTRHPLDWMAEEESPLDEIGITLLDDCVGSGMSIFCI